MAALCRRVLLPVLLLPWVSTGQGLSLPWDPAVPDAPARFPWDGGEPAAWENMGTKGLLQGLPKRSDHNSMEGSEPDQATLLLEESMRKAFPWLASPGAGGHAPVKKSSAAKKVSLSLDVPTHILKILLDLAREKELQAKAAANAELMARIGRRR
ncbi:urocortin-2 [Anser cygnoides]|uniref:urocortin-2 n=1 Tax=Anser cygnoides TaxID=8845 RepID=UPI0034D27AD9